MRSRKARVAISPQADGSPWAPTQDWVASGASIASSLMRWPAITMVSPSTMAAGPSTTLPGGDAAAAVIPLMAAAIASIKRALIVRAQRCFADVSMVGC